MAIVGAMTLARRGGLLPQNARVIPGAQLLAVSDIDPSASHDVQTAIESNTTNEAARVLEIVKPRDHSDQD